MKKTIVVYGSSTGTCEAIAQKIANKLGVECINVADLSADIVADAENLLLGTSTWGAGELQDDWDDGTDRPLVQRLIPEHGGTMSVFRNLVGIDQQAAEDPFEPPVRIRVPQRKEPRIIIHLEIHGAVRCRPDAYDGRISRCIHRQVCHRQVHGCL